MFSETGTSSKIGPGSYETTLTLGNRKPMKRPFGSSFAEFDISTNYGKDVPPVGSYNVSVSMNSKTMKNTFPKDKRNVFFVEKNTNPSPALYNSVDSWITEKKHVARIIPPRPQNKFFENLPKNKETCEPELGIKNAFTNEQCDLEWIGPGTYDSNKLENFFQPKYTMSIAKSRPLSCIHDFSSNKDTPGPGSYDVVIPKTRLSHAIRENPQNSLHEKDKFESNPTFLGPTPWAYAYSETSQAFKSKTKRFKSPVQDTRPGPADYFVSETPTITAHSSNVTSRKSSCYSSAFISSRASSRSIMSNYSSCSTSKESFPSSALVSGRDLAQTATKQIIKPRGFSVLTRSMQRERKINLDSPATDTFWMIEEVEAEAKRPKLVQRMKNV